jgi:autophagy-related protein 13
VSPAANAPPLLTESHTFPSVPHPYGSITISVRYLTNPHFQLDELESLLSSRFFSLDEGADFTPTLVKNQQRESFSSSPGSLPLRTSLPASPPSTTSLTDRITRQVSQPSQTHSRTTSFPTLGASTRHPPLQIRPGPTPDTGGVISGQSSVSSRQEVLALPATNARLRKESMGSVSASSTCHVRLSHFPFCRTSHPSPDPCRFAGRSSTRLIRSKRRLSLPVRRLCILRHPL